MIGGARRLEYSGCTHRISGVRTESVESAGVRTESEVHVHTDRECAVRRNLGVRSMLVLMTRI